MEKTGSRRKHRFFLSCKRKKETAKTESVQKNVLFGMSGRYVKGENKGQNKDNQNKENREKKFIQKGQSKRETKEKQIFKTEDKK